jgi:hypothetical protein
MQGPQKAEIIRFTTLNSVMRPEPMAQPTGCTRRDDAVGWCETRLKDIRQRREKVTVAEYADGFWRSEAPLADDP